MAKRIAKGQSRRRVGADIGNSSPYRRIVNALGIGVVSQEGETLRRPFFCRQLQRVVGRVDIEISHPHLVHVVLRKGSGTPGDVRVKLGRFADMAGMRTDIRRTREHSPGHLVLDRQVPVVHGRSLDWMVGVPGDHQRQWRTVYQEGRCRRRRENSGELYALWAATVGSLCRTHDTVWVTEGTRLDASFGCVKDGLRTEGCYVHKPVIDDAFLAGTIEDAGAAANTGFSIAGDVIGETDARSKIVIAAAGAGMCDDPRITHEEQSRRSKGEYCGLYVRRGCYIGGVKEFYTVLLFLPGQQRLPAQAEVQGQTAGYLVIILNINSGESVVVLLEFPRSLLELPYPTQQEIRHGKSAVTSVIVEGEQSGLIEQVPDINTAEFKDAAEVEGVLSENPAYVVIPGIVVADKFTRGVVSKAEEPTHVDGLNGFGSRLESEI